MEKQKVWIITSNYCSDEDGCGETVMVEGVFIKAEDAQAKFNELCDDMYMEALDLYDKDDLDEDKYEAYYSVWKKEEYQTFHSELRIHEKEIEGPSSLYV